MTVEYLERPEASEEGDDGNEDSDHDQQDGSSEEEWINIFFNQPQLKIKTFIFKGTKSYILTLHGCFDANP